MVLFTVRRSDSFQQDPLNALNGSLPELFDLRKTESELGYPFCPAVIAQRQMFRKLFVALADRRPELVVSVYYCCRGDTSVLASNLTSRADQLRSTVQALFSDAQVSVTLFGAGEILELARRQATYSLRLKFTESYISREGRSYIFLATLPDYFAFITDEHGGLRRYLFESNVRDYLGEVQINEDIRATLESNASASSEDFWWLNNGVTILASHATVAGKEISLENVQIVNGLQTTETIYRYFSGGGSTEDERAVLLKVLLASEDAARARIVKATNYQNTVDLSSLRGLDKIQQDIEHYFLDHGWFYDRRKNYYKNLGKPADRIVSIPYLAAAVRAIALKDPARSQRQRSRSLREDTVYREVFNPRWDLNVYLAALEITRKIETNLNKRQTVFDTPPIALVHYLAFIYACRELGGARYDVSQVAKLAGHPPTAEDISSIRQQMTIATKSSGAQGRRIEGISLNKDFLTDFVNRTYGGK